VRQGQRQRSEIEYGHKKIERDRDKNFVFSAHGPKKHLQRHISVRMRDCVWQVPAGTSGVCRVRGCDGVWVWEAEAGRWFWVHPIACACLSISQCPGQAQVTL
jgi:hypothetical protein